MSKKDQEKRRNNYLRLKDVGYDSYEATRFKDLTPRKIEALILEKQQLNCKVGKILEESKNQE